MKKAGLFLMQLVIAFFIFLPFKVNASSVVFTCDYDVSIDNESETLSYAMLSGNNVALGFSEGYDLFNNSLKWYHDTSFSSDFELASKISGKAYTCPTLFLNKKDNKVTIYARLDNNDICDGVCTKLEAKKLSFKDKTSVVLIKDSGVIKTDSDLNVYFRLLKNGNKQWSIDGVNYTSVNNSIDNFHLSKKFVRSIFKSNGIDSTKKGYLCGNDDGFEIASNQNSCKSTKTLMTSISNSAGVFMANKNNNNNNSNKKMACTGSRDSLLGDPNDEDSVAWLVQKVLNYIKIIGPVIVIIFSSIDYLRALVQSDDETLAKLNKKLITRIVLVLLLFFIPTIVSALLALFGLTNSEVCNLE